MSLISNTEFNSAIASATDPAGDKKNPETNCRLVGTISPSNFDPGDVGDRRFLVVDVPADQAASAFQPHVVNYKCKFTEDEVLLFLEAAYPNPDDDICVRHNGKNVVTRSAQFLIDHSPQLSLDPILESGAVAFIWSALKDVYPDGWQKFQTMPTAALWKDGWMIVIWALSSSVTVEEATDVADWLGIDSVDIPIPFPTENGWRLVHVEPDVSFTIRELRIMLGMGA